MRPDEVAVERWGNLRVAQRSCGSCTCTAHSLDRDAENMMKCNMLAAIALYRHIRAGLWPLRSIITSSSPKRFSKKVRALVAAAASFTRSCISLVQHTPSSDVSAAKTVPTCWRGHHLRRTQPNTAGPVHRAQALSHVPWPSVCDAARACSSLRGRRLRTRALHTAPSSSDTTWCPRAFKLVRTARGGEQLSYHAKCRCRCAYPH